MVNTEELMGPEEYYEQLQGLYLDESEMDLSSDFEARATLVKLNRLETDISKLKRKISKEMRTIRTMYLDESIIEKPKILGIFSRGKNLTKTQKRKQLLAERESRLVPYEEIIVMINDYLDQLEDLRKYIENEVLETYSQIPKYKKVSKADKNKVNNE